MLKNTLILLIGSNQNNPKKQVHLAQKHISKKIGVVLKASQSYRTQAWGNEEQAPFINKALLVQTPFPPQLCLKKCLEIETAMGRKRIKKWEPRIIDIDIIFYNSQSVKTPHLTIPHPHLQDRNFALVCLNDIIPKFEHPLLKKQIQELLAMCSDTLSVKKA